MWIIVNRHREILATDGEFYPTNTFPVKAAHLFPSEEAADHFRSTIREYTRAVRAESSL